MQQKDLISYIKAEIGKGTPRREITNALHANGWGSREIEEAYTRALAQLSMPAPSPHRSALILLLLLALLLGIFFLIRFMTQ